MKFQANGLLFSSDFDSGNLGHVESIDSGVIDICSPPNKKSGNFSAGNSSILSSKVDYDIKVWTSPDCAGTKFENSNRTWFYFGVTGYNYEKLIRITIMNLNKQAKIYTEGYTVVHKVCGNNIKESFWNRIRDRPAWTSVGGEFRLTFVHQFGEGKGTTTYFAFAYPWSFTDNQMYLARIESKFSSETIQPSTLKLNKNGNDLSRSFYFHRELLCYSLEGRRIDLLTITDWSGQSDEREAYFDVLLFPDRTKPRPWKFMNKKVIVLTARVHPGETPSSHVFNGLLEFLLRPTDARACELRKHYVFKLIPMLNPDGVVRGHYRTDSRGVNLNRMYLTPDFLLYPSVYAAKALLVYHHTVYGTSVPYASFLHENWANFLAYYQASSQLHTASINELSSEASAALESTGCEAFVKHVRSTPQSNEQSPSNVPLDNDSNGQLPVSVDVKCDMLRAAVASPPKPIDKIETIENLPSFYEEPLEPKMMSTSTSQSMTSKSQYPGYQKDTWSTSLGWAIDSPEIETSQENSLMEDEFGSHKKTNSEGSLKRAGDLQQSSITTSTTAPDFNRLTSQDIEKSHSETSLSITNQEMLNICFPSTKNSFRKSFSTRKSYGRPSFNKAHRARSLKADCFPYFISKWMPPICFALTDRKCSSTDKVKRKTSGRQKSLSNGNIGHATSAKSTIHESERFSAKSHLAGKSSRISLKIAGNHCEQQIVSEEINQELDTLNVTPGNEGSDIEEDGQNCGDTKPTDDNLALDESVNPVLTYLRNQVKNFWKDSVGTSEKGQSLEEMLQQLDELRKGDHLANPAFLELGQNSGVELYVDLHAHCSKRGCFFYGNYLPDEDEMVDNVLLAALFGVNSPYFDFAACNFSVRNMYQRDRIGTLTKEGAGRVAVWKHLGLVHSYTLECNYNAGPLFSRLSRAITAISCEDKGRSTPPGTLFGPHWSDIAGPLRLYSIKNEDQSLYGNGLNRSLSASSRFSPAHYESVGRAMLIAVLDLRQINPWPRLNTLSGSNAIPYVGTPFIAFGFPELANMKALREWIRKFIRGTLAAGNKDYTGPVKQPNKVPLRRQTIISMASPRDESNPPIHTFPPISALSRTSIIKTQSRDETHAIALGNQQTAVNCPLGQVFTGHDGTEDVSLPITLTSDLKPGTCTSPTLEEADSDPDNSLGDVLVTSTEANSCVKQIEAVKQQRFNDWNSNRYTNKSNTPWDISTSTSLLPFLSGSRKTCAPIKHEARIGSPEKTELHGLTWPRDQARPDPDSSTSLGCSLLTMSQLAMTLPEATSDEFTKSLGRNVSQTGFKKAGVDARYKLSAIKTGRMLHMKKLSTRSVPDIRPEIRSLHQRRSHQESNMDSAKHFENGTITSTRNVSLKPVMAGASSQTSSRNHLSFQDRRFRYNMLKSSKTKWIG